MVGTGVVYKGQIYFLDIFDFERLAGRVHKSNWMARMRSSGCEPDSTNSPIGVSEAPTALLARNRSTGGAFFEVVMQQTKLPTRTELESEIAWLRKQLERAMQERNAYQARAKELRAALMSIASQHPVLKGRRK